MNVASPNCHWRAVDAPVSSSLVYWGQTLDSKHHRNTLTLILSGLGWECILNINMFALTITWSRDWTSFLYKSDISVYACSRASYQRARECCKMFCWLCLAYQDMGLDDAAKREGTQLPVIYRRCNRALVTCGYIFSRSKQIIVKSHTLICIKFYRVSDLWWRNQKQF